MTIVGTELKKYTYNAGGVTATAVDNTKEWTYVSGAANDNDFIGVGDGQLWFIDNGITISILNYQVGWKAAAIGNNDLLTTHKVIIGLLQYIRLGIYIASSAQTP